MFLDKLAEELISKFGKDLPDVCVVFPSRRACLYFKKYLGRKFDKPVFSPAVFSLEDFYEHLSSYRMADRLELVFELYNVYKGLTGTDNFVRFFPWGQMLLDDFDEIDKNLVDVSVLFRALAEQRKIDDSFRLNLAEIESLRKFYETFLSQPLTGEENDFSKLWEIIGTLYKRFKQNLRDKNTAYEGMLQGEVYRGIVNKTIEPEWGRIVFAGFNFLNTVDKSLIRHLLKSGKALVYWDSDLYYFDDPKMEAGKFLRENVKELNVPVPKGENASTIESKKNFKIVGAPLSSGQAKALGELLKKHIAGHGEDDTLIVLPEEKLLQPVLHSVPDEVQNLNVTMGYPFKYSQFFILCNLLRSLHKNVRFRNLPAPRFRQAGEPGFYYKDVVNILLHPYIKRLAERKISHACGEIKEKNIIYINFAKLQSFFGDDNGMTQRVPASSGAKAPSSQIKVKESGMSFLSRIFYYPGEGEGFKYIFDILDLIYTDFISKTKWNFETEHFSVLYSQLSKFYELCEKYETKFDVPSFWNMLLEMLRFVKIPFTGEPLKGLQIMGLLETRALNFKNVFILSVNEGVLPKGYTNYSFIPYNLKKQFKLPTFEEFDADTAYNFYRLLQGAENVYLIYNTEVDELFSGEKSRFIHQLENELLKDNSDCEKIITESSVSVPQIEEISIRKSEEILNKLRGRNYLSVSDLITYITCPLKFYLSRIAGLKEDEGVSETITAGDFGTILHAIMGKLYSGYKEKDVTVEVIDKLIELLKTDYDNILNEALFELTRTHDFEIEGMNLLYKEVVRKLAGKILENDKKESPFTLLGIEEGIQSEIKINSTAEPHNVTIRGRIDRIEMKNGCTRIIDYKTGKVGKISNPGDEAEKFFNSLFEELDNKESFQLYLYAYLYYRNNPKSNFRTGIYPVKRLGGGINFLREEDIPAEHFNMFEERLKTLLEKIFNPQIPFFQTPNVKNCKFCPFTGICYRD